MEAETYAQLLGNVAVAVDNVNNEELRFAMQDGRNFRFLHFQDCCERVRIEDICGDLTDLVGSPFILAECVKSEVLDDEENYERQRWTFYRFATAKGHVDVRWYGTSNGFYSEAVSFEEAPMDWDRSDSYIR